MADRANVTDIEALERFRNRLALFLEKASSALDEVGGEVKRTRIWLQSEQKLVLDREIRRRGKELEQLEAEYFSARLSDRSQKKSGIQMAINRKRREIRELEDKRRAVATWLRHFDSRVEIEARKVDKLRGLLDGEMRDAIRFLDEAAGSLRRYGGDPGEGGGS